MKIKEESKEVTVRRFVARVRCTYTILKSCNLLNNATAGL